jgi:acetyl-CoA carboxylase biotin carboxyl carrier protein
MREIRAEMAGSVLTVTASEGQHVDDGDELVILEAMKMEIPVVAEGSGVVAQVKVAEGDSVNESDVLVVLEEA